MRIALDVQGEGSPGSKFNGSSPASTLSRKSSVIGITVNPILFEVLEEELLSCLERNELLSLLCDTVIFGSVDHMNIEAVVFAQIQTVRGHPVCKLRTFFSRTGYLQSPYNYMSGSDWRLEIANLLLIFDMIL